jgi:hypothetical protein
MMFIASLIELPNAKTRMCKKHKIQLAKFDKASLRVIWLRCGGWLLTPLFSANRKSAARAQPPCYSAIVSAVKAFGIRDSIVF